MNNTNILSEPARKRGLIALLIDVFCMYTGFFMVVPLISVHYVDGLAWATTLPLLFLSALLAAIGGALFESPRAAAIAALTRPEERQRFYSLAGVIGGIGMAIGPLLGAALLHVDFAVVALVGAACFTVNLIQTIIMLPSVRVATSPG